MASGVKGGTDGLEAAHSSSSSSSWSVATKNDCREPTIDFLNMLKKSGGARQCSCASVFHLCRPKMNCLTRRTGCPNLSGLNTTRSTSYTSTRKLRTNLNSSSFATCPTISDLAELSASNSTTPTSQRLSGHCLRSSNPSLTNRHKVSRQHANC